MEEQIQLLTAALANGFRWEDGPEARAEFRKLVLTSLLNVCRHIQDEEEIHARLQKLMDKAEKHLCPLLIGLFGFMTLCTMVVMFWAIHQGWAPPS